MCGRFSQTKPSEIIAQAFCIADVPSLMPRYNIAPTQTIGTVLQTADDSQRQFKMLHWGLIPGWAKDEKMGAKLINARAETVTEKPAFRTAFRKRRCLIVADGFYEWQHKNGQKQPFYFCMQDEQPFAFAGLWEVWKNGDKQITSCTILTTEANDLLKPIHDRMPVILAPKDYNLWLDSTVKTELLPSLLKPYSSEEMNSYAVSKLVNNPSNDNDKCIQSIEAIANN